ncbi:hypothetical protein ABZ462_20215, partial [Streptomyces albogriseolus]
QLHKPITDHGDFINVFEDYRARGSRTPTAAAAVPRYGPGGIWKCPQLLDDRAEGRRASWRRDTGRRERTMTKEEGGERHERSSSTDGGRRGRDHR